MTDLDTIKELLARATKGPWHADGGDVFIDTREQVCCLRGSASGECCGNPDVIGDYDRIAESSPPDAALIALAPELAQRLIEAEARVAEMRNALRGMSITTILSVGDGHCLLCDGRWKPGEPEAHGPGCLAALTQPTDGEKL